MFPKTAAFFVLFCASEVMAQTKYELELNLTSTLLTGYKKNDRPAYKVKVELIMFINQITAIDDSNQQMKSSINIMAMWKDQRLAWNRTDYDLEYVPIKAESIYLPDLVVLNSASTSIFLSIDSKSLVYLLNNGWVAALYSVPSLATRCSMDVTKFPMDRQKCPIKISSWALCAQHMNITIDQVVTDFYTENAVWSLDKNAITYSYTLERDRYSYLAYSYNQSCDMFVASVNLRMSRLPLYYMINMIFPSFILTIATIICFALPAALQFSISLTIFLNYSISSVRIASLMPVQSTNLPTVTWYFFGSMMITLVSFLWFVLDFVLRAFSYMPGWLTIVCVHIRSWSRFIKSKWTSLDCKCKKVDQNGVSSKMEEGQIKDPENEERLVEVELTDPGCNKCQSCNYCKQKDQVNKSNEEIKAEFNNNMLCLNRIVLSITLTAIVVFNLACWIDISS